MVHYIDAEKLIAEIERLEGENNCGTSDFIEAKRIAYNQVKEALDSLQQEQSEVDLEEEMFKEWGTTKEEYLAKSMDKVHLEMEIATYLQDWEDDDEIGLHLSTDEGCIPIELEDVRDMARHFYEQGKKAKEDK